MLLRFYVYVAEKLNRIHQLHVRDSIGRRALLELVRLLVAGSHLKARYPAAGDVAPDAVLIPAIWTLEMPGEA